MNKTFLLRILLSCICSSSLAVSVDVGQDLGFMYQGLLSEQGQRANGIYDLQFRLTDGPTNGNYLGDLLTQPEVSVTNGVFNVLLNFEAALFDGSARWLELGVRTNGSADAYTLLQPLQP